MDNLEIVNRMKSRRNKVYKVKFKESNLFAVMKVYSNKDDLLNEYKNLKKLFKANIDVPKVLFKSENCLILEYISGNLLNDLHEENNLGIWIEELAIWMAKLHEIKLEQKVLLKNDSNLRNFIFSKSKIYGIDFEEMKYGDARDDLGDICFFLLTNFPSFTDVKKVMFKRFLKSYEEHKGIKLGNIEYYISKSADKAMKRRLMHMKTL